jgi:hypothetical protein
LAGRTYPLPALTAIQDAFVFLEHDTHPQRGSGERVGTGRSSGSGGQHIHRFQVFANRDPLGCITLTRLYVEAVVMAGGAAASKSEQLSVARRLS